MTKQMLIDAAHSEEVRVCVLEHGKVEDFDFELSSRKPLRGNIYLARVTRVEPSLQAAFVEYGGNRHGFLAFNEIHPDYYQIPVSDRRLLQEAEAEEASLAAELELEQRGDDRVGADDDYDLDVHMDEEAGADVDEADDDEDEESVDEDSGEGAAAAALDAAPQPEISEDAEPAQAAGADDTHDADDEGDTPEPSQAAEIETPAAEDEAEARPRTGRRAKRSDHRNEVLDRYKEARRKRARLLRNYKIQEVIKRRQILLVQVVKEERGNKGAALTSYLSLAGRYCVLMPNTARGGGISRKIPGATDRQRLRHVVGDLDVPKGMGLIIRTAGAKRTKAEVKRDYDYLIRLWENIRSLTLSSIAPCLIYEEASLIKRAIRDLYDKDISVILVEGDAGYREAKDFMKMLMPSHAKNVQPYKEKTPLFLKHGVESQLDAMYHPTVRLKSGGYLVIHQTEALVAIDVNSGKSTRERNIELTALKTNLEAAREAARQCRLRDLAGLIVIDFIDMMENRNNRSVEKALKDAMKSDRARIQLGRISNFGLMELSRQRRRSSLVEGTTHACPTCSGAGTIRSNEMAALRILRAIEGDALSARAAIVSLKTSLDVALYMLNHKRAWLKRIEDDYALSIEIVADTTKAGDQYEIEKRGEPRDLTEMPAAARPDLPEIAAEAEAETETTETAAGEPEPSSDEAGPGGRKRRRRRRRRHDEPGAQEPLAAKSDTDQEGEAAAEPAAVSVSDSDEDQAAKKRRRRGRRGGRRNRRKDEPASETAAQAGEQPNHEPLPDKAYACDAPPPIAREVQPDSLEFGMDADKGDDGDHANPARSEEKSEEEEEGSINGSEVPATRQTHADEAEHAAGGGEEGPARPEMRREPKPGRRGWWQRALGG